MWHPRRRLRRLENELAAAREAQAELRRRVDMFERIAEAAGAALDGSVLDGSVLDGSVLDGAALDGAALDGSVLAGPAAGRLGGRRDGTGGGRHHRGDLHHARAASADRCRAGPDAGARHRTATPAARRACPSPGPGTAGGSSVGTGRDAGQAGTGQHAGPVRAPVPGTIARAVAASAAVAFPVAVVFPVAVAFPLAVGGQPGPVCHRPGRQDLRAVRFAIPDRLAGTGGPAWPRRAGRRPGGPAWPRQAGRSPAADVLSR